VLRSRPRLRDPRRNDRAIRERYIEWAQAFRSCAIIALFMQQARRARSLYRAVCRYSPVIASTKIE
jgi:hypothetical protein